MEISNDSYWLLQLEERSHAAAVFSYNSDEDSGRALIISAFSASRKSFTSFAVMFRKEQ